MTQTDVAQNKHLFPADKLETLISDQKCQNTSVKRMII